MKKIILSLFVLGMAVGVQAQETPEKRTDKSDRQMGLHQDRHGRHGRHGMMDMKALNLTEDQKAKFKSQNESFHKQMEELKKNDNITVREWRNKAENLRKEHKQHIQSILTNDQKAQLEKMKAEAKARHGEMKRDRADRGMNNDRMGRDHDRMNGDHNRMDGDHRRMNGDRQDMGRNRGERMKTELGLTEEQAAKMKANREAMGDKFKAIRENKSLSEEQKKEQIKELMKAQKENMKSILTEEQMKKLENMRQQRLDGDRKKQPVKQSSI